MKWFVGMVFFLFPFSVAPYAQAAIPLKKILTMIDYDASKASDFIKKELALPSYSTQERAQLLQLLSFSHYNLGQQKEAQSYFEKAVLLDPHVKLLGDASPAMRQTYETWRKQFAPSPVRKPPPPKADRTTGRILYGVLFGLAAAALVGGGITAALANGQSDEYKKLQSDKTSENTEKKIEVYTNAKTLETISIASFVSGSVLLLAGVVVAVLIETSKPPSAPPVPSSLGKNEAHPLLFKSF